MGQKVTYTEVEDVRCIHESEKALKIRLNGVDRRDLWVPRSAVSPESEVQEVGDEGTLLVATWYAEREAL
jgi:hypothetical protein